MGLCKFLNDLHTFRLGASFSQIRTHISASVNGPGKKMGMCIQERGHNHFFSVIVKRPVCIILISLEIPGKNCLDLFVHYCDRSRSGEIFKTCKNSFTSQNNFPISHTSYITKPQIRNPATESTLAMITYGSCVSACSILSIPALWEERSVASV